MDREYVATIATMIEEGMEAGEFSTFYENCPVLKAPDEATRGSRLALVELTSRTLAQGLGLLGIRTVERM